LLKKASNLLASNGHESRLDGYQSGDRQRPYMVASALWSVICGEGISYCVPPASFAKNGQKIRLSSDISKSLLATCLDTALLFASCLEQAGLNSVIALTKTHAMVGVWLIDECFPLLTSDDPVDLRNRIALEDLILFETTLATNDHPIKFAQAIREADKKIAENVEDEFVFVLDIKQARSRKIRPIDFGDDNPPIPAEKLEKGKVELPPPPVLPPVTQPTSSDEDLSPSGRVDQWRRKLLDLSKRNKLLNIRQRSIGFRIICPDLALLENELASGKKYNVISKDALKSQGRSSEKFTLVTGDDLEEEFVKDQLRRGSLIADVNDRELEKNLISLYRRAKSDLEEGGSNTLFLALGMLRWKENSRSEQSYKAPLILLPVKLDRTSARAKPKLMLLPDEDPVFNQTLIELLLQDFEIDLSVFEKELPKDASGVDVLQIWNTVRLKIKDTPGFEVVEELVLSNFSFAKYQMWKDLSDRLDDLKKSQLVNHLVEHPTEPYPHRADFIDPSDVDEKINPEDFYAPLNADSSQMVAIEASAKGKDFVLEGPPGTGKSETIANIIAHNMALGRKVLFVSEKMAALDVVYSRLKRVGLGHLCLELHSRKATKKNVIDQLGEAWQAREGYSTEDWKQKARELGSLRRELNRYVEELHRKCPLGYSAWDAVARSVKSGSTSRINLGWPRDLGSAPVKTESDVRRAKEAARDLGRSFNDTDGINTKAFSFINHSSWTPIWEADLGDAANDLRNKILVFERQFDDFVSSLGIEHPNDLCFASLGPWIEIAKTCIDCAGQSHRFALDHNADKLLEQLDELARIKGQYDSLISLLGLSISPEAISELPIGKWIEISKRKRSPQEQFSSDGAIIDELRKLGFKIPYVLSDGSPRINELMTRCGCALSPELAIKLPLSRWVEIRDTTKDRNGIARFFAKWKVIRQMRRAGLKKAKDLHELDFLMDLSEAIVDLQNATLEQWLCKAREISELTIKLMKIFADYNGDGILDQWSVTKEEILERKDYGVSVRRNFMNAANQLPDPEVFMASIREKLIAEREFLEGSSLLRCAENLRKVYVDLVEGIDVFKKLSGLSNVAETQFQELKDSLREISSSRRSLRDWCHWVDDRNRANDLEMGALVRGLENGLIDWNETEEQFESALCNWLAPILITESDVLCSFSASKHDDLIEEFRKLDEDVASTTGRFVAAKLAGEMPETSGPNAPHEYGVLARELQRKRRHKPVRKLVQEMGSCLLNLTPCFMMSPLSVAQYLPSDYHAFDLVVFDEASQITVWDAVGSIARGKNVIVVGDPKQMPPTNFFNRSQDVDESDEADLESILDQAMAARVACHRLTGHYRSRHESLIAFSNYQYYQNNLTTYPCAETRQSAVIWHRVQGLYSRGAGRNNPIEARAVVDEVVRRLKDPKLQRLSIGIVALNTEQQQLIENLLDDERRKDPSLERFFRGDVDEPVFVKNLETVQGDQRDVICLSVGYGPTEPGAETMSMNFGPLNRLGGERRLNVAITRASTEMLVFTSFDPSMIDLSRTSSEAVKDLKAYIDYAKRGPIALAQRSEFVPDVDQFDSEFEQAVATKLREKGWKLKTQIGVSKFRIDLGVLNPDSAGSFLAGIECDGASYHSSPAARDRDRVRHIILENLGWNLIRIWSTDYFVDPEKVIDRVHRELEELLRRNRENIEKEQKEEPHEANETSEDDANEEDSEKAKESSEPTKEEDAESPPSSVSSSDLFFLGTSVEKYMNYDGEATQDPRSADIESVMEGLIRIVEIEGPMLCKKAYDVYLRHCGIKRMGRELKGAMNRALQRALNKGLITKSDEWQVGGLLYSIIHLPGRDAPRLRDLGDRTIDEVPPSEILEVSKFVLSENDVEVGSEEHLRHILRLYGLKRLTKHTREKLLQVVGRQNPSQEMRD